MKPIKTKLDDKRFSSIHKKMNHNSSSPNCFLFSSPMMEPLLLNKVDGGGLNIDQPYMDYLDEEEEDLILGENEDVDSLSTNNERSSLSPSAKINGKLDKVSKKKYSMKCIWNQEIILYVYIPNLKRDSN